MQPLRIPTVTMPMMRMLWRKRSIGKRPARNLLADLDLPLLEISMDHLLLKSLNIASKGLRLFLKGPLSCTHLKEQSVIPSLAENVLPTLKKYDPTQQFECFLPSSVFDFRLF